MLSIGRHVDFWCTRQKFWCRPAAHHQCENPSCLLQNSAGCISYTGVSVVLFQCYVPLMPKPVFSLGATQTGEYGTPHINTRDRGNASTDLPGNNTSVATPRFKELGAWNSLFSVKSSQFLRQVKYHTRAYPTSWNVSSHTHNLRNLPVNDPTHSSSKLVT